jgi:Tol biopolymer transport system component
MQVRRSAKRRLVQGLAALVVIGAIAMLWVTSVARPPDRIAFVAENNGTWDLWWMAGDATGLARLTTTPLDERAPAISPDRSRIAYSTSDGALWILNTGDRNVTRLALQPGRYSNPSWSLDGRQIVYTAYTMTGDSEDATLWVYDVPEQKAREVLRQDGAQDYAKFSPDGQTLLYSSSGAITVFGFGYSVVQQLWSLSLTTGRAQELLLARGKDTQPVWAPDGRAIAFVSDREASTQVWRVDATGEGLKRLTDGPTASAHPAWSPDGREIVYVASDGRTSRLSIVAADGGASRPLEIRGSQVSNVRDPHWR